MTGYSASAWDWWIETATTLPGGSSCCFAIRDAQPRCRRSADVMLPWTGVPGEQRA